MNEDRDALAYLCHEISNPLNSLLFKVYLIKRDDPSLQGGQTIKELAASALFDIERITRLMEDAKNFYVFKHKETVQEEVFSLSDVIFELIDSGIKKHKEKLVDISFTKNTDGRISADKIRILQAIGNILDNAIKFSPAGHQVTIRLNEENGYLIVRIKDLGPGIEKADLDRIFDPYVQLNKRTKEGFGLGLYLSKKFIESHAGTLSVESEQGNGSEFTVVLPKFDPTKLGRDETKNAFSQNSDKSGFLRH
jgi:two-component system phosphate regulon sensor histidine kinase PhoR